MDTSVASTVWLLKRKLLWAFEYEFLCEHVFSFVLDIYLGVEVLGHMPNFWGNCQIVFQSIFLA